MPLETEIKFEVPLDRLPALRAALRRASARSRQLQARYFDTPDDRLCARGLVLRVRKEGRVWRQTAKALTAQPLERLEHEVKLAATTPGGRPTPKVELHADSAVGRKIIAALKPRKGEQKPPALVERYAMQVRRTKCLVQQGDSCIELALDLGQIQVGSLSAPVCELELELKSGSVADLLALASSWASSHGLWLCTVSKAERALRLLHGPLEGRPIKSSPVHIAKDASPAAFFAAALSSCMLQITGNASELGLGGMREEFVHQLRVGLRRLRTLLRELANWSPSLDPTWDAVFRATFHALGAHRDEVVILPRICQEMRRDGLEPQWATRHLAARRSPMAIVRDPQFQAALLAVWRVCYEPEPGANASNQNARVNICQVLEGLHQRMCKEAPRFAKLEPEHQHRLRRRLKRLRYLSEFSTGLFERTAVRDYIDAWRGAQDSLGHFSDYLAGLDALEQAGRPVPQAKAVKRWLHERLDLTVKDCTAALTLASKQPKFWQAPNKRKK